MSKEDSTSEQKCVDCGHSGPLFEGRCLTEIVAGSNKGGRPCGHKCSFSEATAKRDVNCCVKCGHNFYDPQRRGADQFNTFCVPFCGCECVFPSAASEVTPPTKPYKEHLRESLQTLDDYVGYLSACHDEGPEVFQLAVKDVLSFARVRSDSPSVDDTKYEAVQRYRRIDGFDSPAHVDIYEKSKDYPCVASVHSSRRELAHRIVALLNSNPNNVVACVNCKDPVAVTALNAIRCSKCSPSVDEAAVRRAAEKIWEITSGADYLDIVEIISTELASDSEKVGYYSSYGSG